MYIYIYIYSDRGGKSEKKIWQARLAAEWASKKCSRPCFATSASASES